jgi:hypothetical protein
MHQYPADENPLLFIGGLCLFALIFVFFLVILPDWLDRPKRPLKKGCVWGEFPKKKYRYDLDEFKKSHPMPHEEDIENLIWALFACEQIAITSPETENISRLAQRLNSLSWDAQLADDRSRYEGAQSGFAKTREELRQALYAFFLPTNKKNK